jgi:hypothetical protein
MKLSKQGTRLGTFAARMALRSEKELLAKYLELRSPNQMIRDGASTRYQAALKNG